MPKEDSYFKPGNTVGRQFQPGVSGNPAGVPRLRLEYEEKFTLYLLGELGPEEAGRILIEAVREKQQWAVLEFLRRAVPIENTIKLKHEANRGDEINWSKMTDAEFETVSKIFERIEGENRLLESGEVPTELP